MTLTEEEAKTKQCQESIMPSRMMAAATGAAACQSFSYLPTKCIGSACMAWRWVIADRADTYGRADRDKGYCGKAGRP